MHGHRKMETDPIVRSELWLWRDTERFPFGQFLWLFYHRRENIFIFAHRWWNDPFNLLFQVRVILLNWCAWFLRMRKPGENRRPIPCKYIYPNHHSSMSSIEMNIVSGNQNTNGNILYCGYHNLESPCCPPNSDSGVMCGRVTCPSLEDSDLLQKKCLRECMPEISKILEEVQYIARRFRDQDEGEEICSEWKFAAAVIDRLCLVAFSLFAIICTITILMSAPNFIEAVSKDFTWGGWGIIEKKKKIIDFSVIACYVFSCFTISGQLKTWKRCPKCSW